MSSAGVSLDLWAAAYWLDGGCSDDGFADFRACLISLGRNACENTGHNRVN